MRVLPTSNVGRSGLRRNRRGCWWPIVGTALLILVGIPLNGAGQQGPPGETVPRVMGLSFKPAQPETGQKLSLRVALKNAIRAEVRWSINGEEAELSDYDGIADHVEFPRPIKAGDKISAQVTPYNAFGESGGPLSKEVTCINAGPWMKLASESIDGDLYRAKIQFGDPEEGAVTLALREGPQGMNVDQQGNITWKLGPKTAGSFPVKVSAKDEQGAEAILSYTLRIRRSGP